MYARNSRRKAKPGSVQVKNSNNRLQLVFSYGGKRHQDLRKIDYTKVIQISGCLSC
jgi:hypothetical protein